MWKGELFRNRPIGGSWPQHQPTSQGMSIPSTTRPKNQPTSQGTSIPSTTRPKNQPTLKQHRGVVTIGVSVTVGIAIVVHMLWEKVK